MEFDAFLFEPRHPLVLSDADVSILFELLDSQLIKIKKFIEVSDSDAAKKMVSDQRDRIIPLREAMRQILAERREELVGVTDDAC